MANDAIIACLAANRDVSQSAPSPFQDCRDVIHISVFFDGTGNNKDKDNDAKKWSNVARMFFASEAYSKQASNEYPIYISGVGTPYNGDAVQWLSKAGVWVQDGLPGLMLGTGGDRRLEQGDDAVNDRLRDVLIANAKKLGGAVSKYAAESSEKSFSDVNAALGKHRLIKVINLSIFGFSRGAALARAFSNRVIDSCEKSGDDLLYQGYPLRVNFMGVFDTVASFGVPAQNVQLPFNERDLTVSAKVVHCVHYVAAHEVRFSFPVDLIRKDGKLAKDNWIEKVYPGVHSDVGGGYEPISPPGPEQPAPPPGSQGITNNYGRLPMRDMMREAVIHGVRLVAYDILESTTPYKALFEERFQCISDTQKAYDAYMTACGPLSGTIESQIRQHMKVLYSAYGTMYRTGEQTPGERVRKADWYKNIGPHGMAWEIDKYRAAAKAAKWVRVSAPLKAYAQFVKPQEWQIAAWDANAPVDAKDFVAKFVHDSKVDFAFNLEPFSYFKPRGVTESNVSIWQEGGVWMGNKAKAIGSAVESGYDATKKGVIKAADATANATNQAYDATANAAKKTADATAKAATQAYDATASAAKKAADATAHAAHQAYDATASAAHAAADATTKVANQAYDATADAAKRAADATAKAARDAAEATQRKAEEAAHYTSQTAKQVENGAQRIFDKGTHWVEQVTKDISTQTGEVVGSAKKVFTRG